MRKRLNDLEMSLFATVKCDDVFGAPVVDANGRGKGDAGMNTYGTKVRKCRYTVLTRKFGTGMVRSFRVLLNSLLISEVHSATVDVVAPSDTGVGFMKVRINKKDGGVLDFNLSQSDARNLAQMMNAASNSCNTKWRKSSITI